MFLATSEVERLTGRRRRSAQIRQLVALGVRHFVDADGSPVVPRSAIEGGGTVKRKDPEPDWGAVRAKTKAS